MPNARKYKWVFQRKGSQIKINKPSASAGNRNLCLDNFSYPTRSYPTRPHLVTS